MSVFFRQLQHLLPRSKFWALTVDRPLRQLFLGLSNAFSDVKDFLDGVWGDIHPSTTRELPMWEEQHGLREGIATKTTEERIVALTAEWSMPMGNALETIEGILQDSGFDVYVHPYWVPGRNAGELAGAYYSGRTLAVANEDTSINGIAFSLHGAFFFAIGATAGVIAEWEIDPEHEDEDRERRLYRLDGAELTGDTLDVTTQAASPSGMAVWGNSLFVLDLTTDTVFEYTLPTAGRLGGATYSGRSLSVSAQQNAPRGICIRPDGGAFFIVGSGSSSLHEYTMPTAGTLTGASYSGNAISVAAATGERNGVTFDGKGETCLVCADALVYRFTLTTGWLISTLLTDGLPAFNPSESSATIRDVFLGGNGGPTSVGYDNGTALFILANDDVWQYSLADYEPRNPHDYLANPLIGAVTCGGLNNTCRGTYPNGTPNVFVVCSGRTQSDPDYIVNLDLTTRAPPQLPTNPDYYPYFFYVGGEVFGEDAEVPSRRRAEFERLLLRLRPLNQWIGLFIEYSDGLVTEEGDALITEDEDAIIAE